MKDVGVSIMRLEDRAKVGLQNRWHLDFDGETYLFI